ncbi:hypothetical protein [Azotobacter beijerinckii]|uniref:Uncharacterized protein n=1 Tax=Azotobacter beijerinckii TaxID=170623 RepID=A0A1I1A577_9GAMM|nr:hypothetical protein [Azotobacter beijerinckii]SFB31738.1 hypothetical protein SAMN04244571_02227 [Azotobacter beijerinckii]
MSKAATEDYRALDVRALHRAGVLVPGWSGNWNWWRNGEKRASIGLEVESRDSVRLRYQVTLNGQAEQMDYPVSVEWMPCHLGGERPWFLCPCCGRRVAKLYAHRLFACRHCLRLNYASQQANKRDRALDRSWDLRRALGCQEGFLIRPAELIRKPKGMHWRTFGRKIEQLKQVDARALDDARAMLASIERGVKIAEAALSRC